MAVKLLKNIHPISKHPIHAHDSLASVRTENRGKKLNPINIFHRSEARMKTIVKIENIGNTSYLPFVALIFNVLFFEVDGTHVVPWWKKWRSESYE